ncbi:MAG TPA: rhodanese-like domain-containing protein [Ilumatobacteraceae bacterium]|nr:rhodanese-like domain-containing protein [Ilumatobacteraceae bacterium]
MAVSEVDVDELAAALQSGASLIDVREIDEYKSGHVPGAVVVPLASVAHALDRFATGQTNYVICRSGARSHRACEFLLDQGIDAVNVAGGLLAWVNSGRDTVAGDQPA